jgi:hypothetical protein
MNQISVNEDMFLYKSKINFIDLPNTLNALFGKDIEEIKVQLLIFNGNFVRAIDEYSDSIKGLKVLKQFGSGEDQSSYEMSGSFGRKNKILIRGKLFVMHHPIYNEVWICISNYGGKFFEFPFRTLIKRIRPRIVKPIITTPQFEELLIQFQKLGVSESIRVIQFGQRAKIKSKGAKRSIESDRKWTDLNIKETFSDAKEAGHWITDIKMEYCPAEHSEDFTIKIDRTSMITFRGETKISFYHFINSISEFSHQRFLFLKDREKSKSNNFISKPFAIRFNSSVLNSSDQVKKLKEAINRIPNFRQTVIHGNPYYHSVLVDFKDGSVSEVLVIDENKINIIPQGKATVRSLQKLCSHIFYNFREGEFVEGNLG